MVSALVLTLLAAGLGWFTVEHLELPDARTQPQSTLVADVNGNLLATFHGEQDRTDVPLGAVPTVVIDAVLAAEDRHFYDHPGVDPQGLARAAWNDVRAGAVEEGGSTITQQYVKNVYLSGRRSFTRKLEEVVLALRVERELTKDQILERYLNTVYFGRGAYGIEAAARVWFGKDVGALRLPEAAYLAGLLRSPSTADASADPAAATARRQSVLDAMVDAGWLQPAERDAAGTVPLTSLVRPRAAGASASIAEAGIGAEYYVDAVRQYLVRRYGEAAVLGGGLRVYTSFDPGLQAHARRAVCGTLDQPGDPSGALVAIDQQGLVRAMVGGCDHAVSQVNLAIGVDGGGSGRQPGSAFKPLLLAAIVHDGYSVASRFPAPATVVIPGADGGRDWQVSNYAGRDDGVIDLGEAMARSANTVFAEAVQALPDGPAHLVATARDLGVAAPLDPQPSLALGTESVSVLDMAAAYSTFANRGVRRRPRLVLRVTDAAGRVLEDNGPEAARVLTEHDADVVTAVLEGVIDHGTGTAAAIGRPAAGKTGTTQDYRDAWFVGFTPQLTAAVWMGYPGGDDRTMADVRGQPVTGGSWPAVIWRQFMTAATNGLPAAPFVDPGPPTGRPLCAAPGTGCG